MALIVTQAGVSSSVQDLGRPGWRHFGVSIGGALDVHAARIANLLAGNEESEAVIEVALGGLQLRFTNERIVTWCGGQFEVRVESMPLSPGRAILVHDGEEMRVHRPAVGCRAWIAISGGLDVTTVLGSRSTDLRAGFGGFNGRTLRDGDQIPLGPNSTNAKMLAGKLHAEKVASWSSPGNWSSPAVRKPILRFVRGADWECFDSTTLESLTREPFAVSPDSDRMGVRLNGPKLKPLERADLVSEPVAPGTIQVPPGGDPILLLGDCQTIGGYPKIGHVITVDLPVAAQLRAGDQVRFHEVSMAGAHLLLLDREKDLEQFRCGLKLHLS
jgi:antagonist of KipI